MSKDKRGGSRRPQCDEMKHFKKGDTILQRELSYTHKCKKDIVIEIKEENQTVETAQSRLCGVADRMPMMIGEKGIGIYERLQRI